jgi:hypothetical protein
VAERKCTKVPSSNLIVFDKFVFTIVFGYLLEVEQGSCNEGDDLRFSGVTYFSSGCFTREWRELFSSFIAVYTECDAESSSETRMGGRGRGAQRPVLRVIEPKIPNGCA